MTDSTSSSVLEALLRLPANIAADLGAALPRLAERTRAQLGFAATVAEKLRCGDLGSRLSSIGAQVPDHLADIVPFEPRATADAESDGGTSVDETTPEREVIEVVTVAAAPRPKPSVPAEKSPATKPAAPKSAAPTSSTATSSTATKAPAASSRKASAKKAPATRAAAKSTPAKKASAKKAPATRAAAKSTPAKKAAAEKAPAKRAAAKSTPAKKASAKKVPAEKASAKKAPAEKAPAEKTPVTTDAVESATLNPASAAMPVGATALAIPGYDALAASQVMPRLESLSPVDLELVRVYELAGRGRRTILSRIAQLQAG